MRQSCSLHSALCLVGKTTMKVNLVIFICETFKLKETHVMYRDREGYGISFGKESACNAGDPGSIWEDPLEKRRAMPKKAQTTTQLHSLHTLVK